MNLPDMLRNSEESFPHGGVVVWSPTQRQGAASIGPELAALVEAADAMVSPDATNPRHVAYANARAALVAKLEGRS